MDRSMLAPRKAEEKELCEKLYKKLYGLTLFFPSSEELRKCLSNDMFIKANQHGFIHVMHFLFRILDPVELKRRFYWPIINKSCEADFRNSTIDYLKLLNEKHLLQWDVKSYLFVIPGGIRFMAFLMEFTGFVIREITRQREKQLLIEHGIEKTSNFNIKSMRYENSFLKKSSSEYIEKMDKWNALYEEKIYILKTRLTTISQNCNISAKELINKKFLKEIEDINQELIKKKITRPIANIRNHESELIKLKKSIEKYQVLENDFKFNKEFVKTSLNKIQEHFPNEEENIEESLTSFDKYPMVSLIRTFNSVFPKVQNILDLNSQTPCTSNFITNEFMKLKKMLSDTETHVNNFQKIFNSNHQIANNNECDPTTPLMASNHCNEQKFMIKYVSTPPIRNDLLKSNLTVRLPLFDDLKTNSMNYLSISATPRSTQKVKKADQPDLYKSMIVNPKNLLQSIRKNNSEDKKTPQHNLSKLKKIWKDQRGLMESGNNETLPATPIKPCATAVTNIVSQSPCTPFNSNESTQICRSEHLDFNNSGGNCSILYTRKITAVKKVQNTSLNFRNISTSPSGRLDTLVQFDVINVPKVQINDCSLNDTDVNKNGDTDVNIDFIRSNEIGNEDCNNENDLNSPIQVNIIDNSLTQINDEDLINISDTVIKDTIM